jgi:glycerophosphoryl diester phosphodiesterase
MACINYAHRGASTYAPENTLAAFYLGLEMGADGIETDIQRTSDGVLVLFHDDDMMRICGLSKSISDYSYQELMRIDFGAYKKVRRYMSERIVTLEEFLLRFGGKQLTFALEIKQLGVEKESLEIVNRTGTRSKVVFTSFMWESLVALRALDKEIALGFLTSSGILDEELDMLEAHGIRQICPSIDKIEQVDVEKAHSRGFSVRTWKIMDVERMRKAIDIGTDGMTVNFPDQLTSALQNKNDKA